MHDDIDKRKDNNKKITDDEEYINDCIKIIMDGNVPDVALSHQKMFPVEKDDNIAKIRQIGKEIGKEAITEQSINKALEVVEKAKDKIKSAKEIGKGIITEQEAEAIKRIGELRLNLEEKRTF